MNYLKKIKALGFKRIPATVVCLYERDFFSNVLHGLNGERIRGFYLKELSLIEDEKNIIPNSAFLRPNKTSTYLYRLSNTLSFYLILVGEEYTFVVKDDTIDDVVIDKYNIRKCNIYITIRSNSMDDNFWKEILGSLDKGIQRELIIKEIFSSQ